MYFHNHCGFPSSMARNPQFVGPSEHTGHFKVEEMPGGFPQNAAVTSNYRSDNHPHSLPKCHLNYGHPTQPRAGIPPNFHQSVDNQVKDTHVSHSCSN
uniref:Uncharacterized protein n=1 Tax=Ciona savignyi TaxID=51511 RepID=H2YF48_CIOSA